MRRDRTTQLGLSLGLTAYVLLATPARLARGDAAAEPPWVWASETASPRGVDPNATSDREADLQRACGRGEAGLRAVAVRLVARKLRDLPYLDADALGQVQRVEGEPHVWPRAWVVSGRALDHDATRQKLVAWGATFREPGERRCGAAIGYGADGTEVIAVIAIDAEADLAPLPVRTRVGAFFRVDATLLVPATAARVILVGPTGRPRSVPTQLDGDRVRAQVALDRPGAFSMQVVVDLPSGPRPVLEAALFADVAPWPQPPDLRAPGETAETALPRDAADHTVLLAMVQALRTHEELASLTPDARLDAVARAHTERMQLARAVAHDVGDGDPTRRFEAAGVSAHDSGENVAHAASIALAHRALYASPSHRANLLSASFDRVGLGVARDPDGSVWVTEEFAGRR